MLAAEALYFAALHTLRVLLFISRRILPPKGQACGYFLFHSQGEHQMPPNIVPQRFFSHIVEGKIKREFKCKFLACHKHPILCIFMKKQAAGNEKYLLLK
jgi:hypothetical protein